jgi:hypothetical protein
MNDTPETDELRDDIWQSVYIEGQDFMQMLEHARRLERQRDSLKNLHNENAPHSAELLQLCGTLQKERDKLTEVLEYIIGIGLTQKTRAKAEKALQSLTNNQND